MDEKRRKEEGEARKSLKNGGIECLRVRMEVENGGFECEKWGERVWVRRRRGNDLGENGFSKLKTRVLPVRGPRSCEQGTSQLRGPNTQNIQKFQGVLAAANRGPRSCETNLAKIIYFSHTH